MTEVLVSAGLTAFRRAIQQPCKSFIVRIYVKRILQLQSWITDATEDYIWQSKSYYNKKYISNNINKKTKSKYSYYRKEKIHKINTVKQHKNRIQTSGNGGTTCISYLTFLVLTKLYMSSACEADVLPWNQQGEIYQILITLTTKFTVILYSWCYYMIQWFINHLFNISKGFKGTICNFKPTLVMKGHFNSE